MTNEELRSRFGKRVKELRLERGMSQFDLSLAAEIGETQIRRIEGGKVTTSIYVAYRLAKAFDLTLGEFFNKF
jgi:transcriptional regulator with XRE-family HTH domain